MIRLKDFFTKSVLRAETIKSQDVVNDANNETETLGLKFTPNYMPYEEKKPYYETGLKKFIENSELNSLNQIKTIVAIPNSSETKNDDFHEDVDLPQDSDNTSGESELKQILTSLGKDIDESYSKSYKKENEQTFTEGEILYNISSMLNSDNKEIAAIGKVLSDVFVSVGVDLPENSSNIIAQNSKDLNYRNIIIGAIFRALKGEEIDTPISDDDIVAMKTDKQQGLSIDELLALDKNGDGSIADELQKILTDDQFLDTCKFMLQREKNHETNNESIMKMDLDKNSKISVSEILNNSGNNPIADLFINDDGTVDRALIIAMGGNMSLGGNYTISTGALIHNLYTMDADRDGIVTKEEVAKFKESQTYKLVSYNVMMSEMERSNDTTGNFDEIFVLEDIEKFVKNNPTATKEQKAFFSLITDINDLNLKKFIMRALGSGAESTTVSQFTSKCDKNGDGIVSYDELKEFVDETTKLYNSLNTLFK